MKEFTSTTKDTIDSLVWEHRTTQLEFFLTPGGSEDILEDPQVKAILIKDKGSYLR